MASEYPDVDICFHPLYPPPTLSPGTQTNSLAIGSEFGSEVLSPHLLGAYNLDQEIDT